MRTCRRAALLADSVEEEPLAEPQQSRHGHEHALRHLLGVLADPGRTRAGASRAPTGACRPPRRRRGRQDCTSTVGMAHRLAVRRRRPHRLQEDRPRPRQGLPAPHTPRRARTTAGYNPAGGGSYSYEAIRRHCKAEAPATLLLSLVGRSSSSTSLIYLVR